MTADTLVKSSITLLPKIFSSFVKLLNIVFTRPKYVVYSYDFSWENTYGYAFPSGFYYEKPTFLALDFQNRSRCNLGRTTIKLDPKMTCFIVYYKGYDHYGYVNQDEEVVKGTISNCYFPNFVEISLPKMVEKQKLRISICVNLIEGWENNIKEIHIKEKEGKDVKICTKEEMKKYEFLFYARLIVILLAVSFLAYHFIYVHQEEIFSGILFIIRYTVDYLKRCDGK